MNGVELNVLGMNCGSCVASVTRSLQDIPGVVSVSVELFGGTARRRHRPRSHSNRYGVVTMIIALAAAGYDASFRRMSESEESLNKRLRDGKATVPDGGAMHSRQMRHPVNYELVM